MVSYDRSRTKVVPGSDIVVGDVVFFVDMSPISRNVVKIYEYDGNNDSLRGQMIAEVLDRWGHDKFVLDMNKWYVIFTR